MFEALAEDAAIRMREVMGATNIVSSQLSRLLVDVLKDGSWAVSGIRSPEHWVAWKCGVSNAHAHRLVTIARRRDELPLCVALFDAGQLSEDAMAAIAQRTPAERDAQVAVQAPLMLHTQLVRFLGTIPRPDDEPEDPNRRHVTFGRNGDRWYLSADLPADEGALVEKALTRARSDVFHEQHPDRQPDAPVSGVSWADGLARMAESSLIGLEGIDKRRPGDRYQVMVHYDVDTAAARLHQGDQLSDSIWRFLSCDSYTRRVAENNGHILGISEKTRTVDDKTRAVVEQRDGGCRVPGCATTRWLHIHHIVHWEDGGGTECCNLCALCPMHHRLHHLGLLDITGNPCTANGLTFRDASGRVIQRVPTIVPDGPPDPPPKPFAHPLGERVDWNCVAWPYLDNTHSDN